MYRLALREIELKRTMIRYRSNKLENDFKFCELYSGDRLIDNIRFLNKRE